MSGEDERETTVGRKVETPVIRASFRFSMKRLTNRCSGDTITKFLQWKAYQKEDQKKRQKVLIILSDVVLVDNRVRSLFLKNSRLFMHSIEPRDENINYGQIIRDWRKRVLGWKNVETAVLLWNEALENEDEVSIRWWQRMEQKNAVPVDEKRRWIIQAILNIPPS